MKKTSLITCLLALLAVNLFSQNTSQLIDDYLISMNQTGKFNGNVLVDVNGSIIFNKGYGYANFEWKVPNSPETKFNIGSISKQFTTVMIFQLEMEGKLKLDDFIYKYLPEYREDIGKKVTIDQLLQHTSGIPCYLRDYKRSKDDNLLFPFPSWIHFTIKELLSKYMSGDLLFEPGSEYRYSNTGFYLLYLIIEKVTGKTYQENLQERILDPLGLRNTGLLDNFKVVDHLSNGYVNTPTGMIKAQSDYEPNYYGAGGIFSTTSDLLTWNRALHSGEFLPATIREKILTPYLKQGDYVRHGYSIDNYMMRLPGIPEPVKYTSFNGAIQGFISDVICFEDDGISIVILDNSNQLIHTRIAVAIFKIIRNQNVSVPKPALSRYIARTAIEEGIDEAVSEYYKILDEDSDQYETGSLSGLSWTAFIYADAGMNEKAMTLLELNTILHPKSDNAYNDFADFLEHINSPDVDNKRETANSLVTKYDFNFEKGRYLSEVKKDYKASLEWLDKNITGSEPHLPSLFLAARSRIYGNIEVEKAIGLLQQYLELNSQASDRTRSAVWWISGKGYEQLGSNLKAVECYKKCLDISPDFNQAKESLNQLKEKK